VSKATPNNATGSVNGKKIISSKSTSYKKPVAFYFTTVVLLPLYSLYYNHPCAPYKKLRLSYSFHKEINNNRHFLLNSETTQIAYAPYLIKRLVHF